MDDTPDAAAPTPDVRGYDDDDLEALEADAAEPEEVKAKRNYGDRTPTELDRRIGTWVQYFRNREPKIALRPLAKVLTERTPASPWNASRISRTELAEGRIFYDDVHDIIAALDVEPVVFYQKAGVIKLPTNLAEMIDADPDLDPEARNLLHEFHAVAVRQAAEREARRADS